MEVPESLQILRNELRRRGLPRDYIERIVEELADHAVDLATERRPSADPKGAPPPTAAQLGDPLLLARNIAREYGRRTFLGRHPWLTFAALPVGAMFAAWFAAVLSIVLVVHLTLAAGGESPSDAVCRTAALLAGGLAFGMTYGMPLFLCWWSLRVARRVACPESWAWLATAVLVFACFFLRIYVFRLDDGQYAIDSSPALRIAASYLLNGDALPGRSLLWWLTRHGTFPFGFLLQVAILIGGTRFTIRRHRREFTAPTAAS